MASFVSRAVASVDFDSFHIISALIIRKAIFGGNKIIKLIPKLLFIKMDLLLLMMIFEKLNQ